VERLDLLGLLRWTEELVSSEIWQRIRWTADFSGTGIQTETKNGGKLALLMWHQKKHRGDQLCKNWKSCDRYKIAFLYLALGSTALTVD
jgi:hypothetical protein